MDEYEAGSASDCAQREPGERLRASERARNESKESAQREETDVYGGGGGRMGQGDRGKEKVGEKGIVRG